VQAIGQTVLVDRENNVEEPFDLMHTTVGNSSSGSIFSEIVVGTSM